MVAAFFLIFAVLLFLIRRAISAEIGRIPSDNINKDYALGAQRSLPILKYAEWASLGLATLALLAEVVLRLL